MYRYESLAIISRYTISGASCSRDNQKFARVSENRFSVLRRKLFNKDIRGSVKRAVMSMKGGRSRLAGSARGGVDLWKFGGPAESTRWLVARKEPVRAGGWKNISGMRADARRTLISCLEGRTRREYSPPFPPPLSLFLSLSHSPSYCYTRGLLIHFHRRLSAF